jgi:hypothetical protein
VWRGEEFKEAKDPGARIQEPGGLGRGKVQLEGSRFGTHLEILSCFFYGEEGQNIALNRRLPRITARDVLPSAPWEIIDSRNVPIDLNTRWVIPGSRPFNKICGHARAERNVAGSLGTIQSGSPPGAACPAHILLAPDSCFLNSLNSCNSPLTYPPCLSES